MKGPIAIAIVAAAFAAFAAAAFAEPPAAGGAAGAGAGRVDNSNEIICRTIHEIGSRLNRTRQCATRAQWDEQRRQDRDLAERAQTNRTWCERGPC